MSAGSMQPSVKNAGARMKDMTAMHFMINCSDMYVLQSYRKKTKETREIERIYGAERKF